MNFVTNLIGGILEKTSFTDYSISQYLAHGTEVALNCGQSLEFSNGRWSQFNRKKVIINSSIQSLNFPIKINYFSDTLAEESNIALNYDAGLDLTKYKFVIFINDTLQSFTNQNLLVSTGLTISEFENELNPYNVYFRYKRCDSTLNLRVKCSISSLFLAIVKDDINSSEIILKPLKSEKKYIPILNKEHYSKLEINVSFADSLFQYHVFKNTIMKVRRKGIFYYNENLKKWDYLKKVF